MGWQDAPVVAAQPKWSSAPLVQQQQPKPSYGAQWMHDINDAGAALSAKTNDIPGVGAGETALTFATGISGALAAALESATLGTPYTEARQKYQYQPRTQSGQAMVKGLAALTKPVGDAVQWATGKASGGLQAVGMPKGAADDVSASAADALGIAATARPMLPKSAPKVGYKPGPVPTTDELGAAKSALYDQAEKAGVVIKPESTAKSAQIFRQVAQKENLGKLTPKLSEAAAVLDERVAGNQPLTLGDADKVRQLINDALKSPDAGDRRLARIVKSQYDGYLDSLGPADTLAGDAKQAVSILKAARETNARFEKSRLVDATVKKAERAGDAKYTQAGDEHALRVEFKKLADNERKMRTMSPDQRQAIEDVARGGSTPSGRLLTNAARNVGKFDPTTGGMAAHIGTATGAIMGGALGGIEGGGIGSVALPTVGFIGKRIATKRTLANVDRARESLVGRGLEQPQPANASAAALAESLEAEAARRGLFKDRAPTKAQAEAEADWRRRYALAQALTQQQQAQQ